MTRIMFFLLLMLMATVPANAQQPAANPSPSKPQPALPHVYVIGKVRKPVAIPFNQPITVLAAVKQAEGAVPNEKSTIAQIYRRTPGCEFVTQIKVALKDIRAGRERDISLQAGDIVEVRSRKRGRFEPAEEAIRCEPPKVTRIIR